MSDCLSDCSVLVSIVTVCFNSEKTISKTIESVLSQTYHNYEHIFIDGGSTDKTLEIINSYHDRYSGKSKVFSGKDDGIYDAMNKGIAHTNGEVIGILNSDDWYENDALKRVVDKYLQRKNDCCIITGNIAIVSKEGELKFVQKHDERCLTDSAFSKGTALQHPAVFVSKETYNNLGTFDTSLKFLADCDFEWRCLSSNSVDFLFTSTVTTNMREGGASDTFKIKYIYRRSVERFIVRKKHINVIKAWFSSVAFFVAEVSRQFLKRILPKKIMKKYYNKKHKDR